MKKLKNVINNTKFKTTTAALAGAVVVFSLSKWYIDGETANLISSILVALWFGANVISYKK